jgi:ABC-2 type transport system ATP-binding protein
LIELKDLQKMVDHNLVVDIDALTVRPGEIAAVVGPVGSGKDHLWELLIGQSRPTVGSVRLAGFHPAQDKAQFSHQVGVLFAEDSLYTRQSPRANLVFHCRLRGLPKSRAEEALQLVGLADHASTRVEQLPSGLVRRLAFGRALLHSPAVYLLVDPFAKCDEASISLLSSLMHQLADEDATLLILADDTANLTSLCDTIYTIEQGRLSEAFQPTEEQEGVGLPLKIPVRLEAKVALVNPADILYAESIDGRAFLHTADDDLPTQFTLGELEKRLSRRGFFRAHRSYLVNLQHVKEVIRYTRNSFSLRLNDETGTKIPLSRSAASELRDLLGY